MGKCNTASQVQIVEQAMNYWFLIYALNRYKGKKKEIMFLGKSEEIAGKFIAKIKILKCNHRRHLIEEK